MFSSDDEIQNGQNGVKQNKLIDNGQVVPIQRMKMI